MVPELHAKAPGFPGLSPTRSDGEHSAEITTSPLFTDAVTRTYRWSATLTADAFVELLLTQSDHRLLPEETRAELLGAVIHLIAGHGGQMVPHATFLILAHSRLLPGMHDTARIRRALLVDPPSVLTADAALARPHWLQRGGSR